MLEPPGLGIVAMGTPNRAIADDTAEHRQHERRLVIGLEAVERTAVVRVPHERRLSLVAADASIRLPEPVEIRRVMRRVGRGQKVHVLIEAFVHPTVPRLVVANHHRPPLIARLVISRSVVRYY